MNAVVHLEIGDNTQTYVDSDVTKNKDLYLSGYDGTTLKTGYRDTVGTMYWTDTPENGTLFYSFPVKAWIENTTPSQTAENKASWLYLIDNADDSKKVTFDFAVKSGANTANLVEGDVAYYMFASAATDKTTEETANSDQIEIKINQFYAAGEGGAAAYSHTSTAPSAANQLDLGYLIVRIKGDALTGEGNTEKVHVSPTEYKVELEATAGTFTL